MTGKVEKMNKITREQFMGMGINETWDHIEALQTELETRVQGFRFDWNGNHCCSGARIIYEHGNFGEVAWDSNGPMSKARLCLYGDGYITVGEYIPRQLPPKVERARTRKELGNELWNLGVRIGDTFHDLKEESVKDLCRVNGVSLTVLEESK